MIIREYTQNDMPALLRIWNEVVQEGVAFPQEDCLTMETGTAFFASQSYTGVAEEDGSVLGLYILHPNNVGRCGHICNASYGVLSGARGRHIGEKLVLDCLKKGRELGYRVLQFNAVVESNIHARHLYERLGFTQLGTVPGGFRMKDGHYENICLYYHELDKEMKMNGIRKSTLEDLPVIMETYAYARSFMAAHGNPNQWGPTNWPPEELIRADIAAGKSYVFIANDQIAGTFFFDQGKDIEPTYDRIENGSWMDDSPYGVIHRIAGNGKAKGVGHAVIEWAGERCPHLRIDTHSDNVVMQNMLKKEGFIHCGTIYVYEDKDPRMAFERV